MIHGPTGCFTPGRTSPTARRGAALFYLCGLAAGLAGLAGGCEVDSFIDPSIIGRWQRTPTSVPILERLSSIEDLPAESVEYSDVTVADLIPEPIEYRIGPGDRLMITLYDDIDNRGIPSNYERDVDIRGNIDLPQLGQINLTNKTAEQARLIIAAALSKFVNDPLVSVVVGAQRQQTFTVMGEVQQPGPYFIAKPDYRLLEALTAAGRFPESIEEIYIIRQIALTDAVKGILPPVPAGPAGDRPGLTTPTPTPATTPPTKPPEKVIDLIDELTKPKEEPKEAPKNPPAVDPKAPSPAVFGPGTPGATENSRRAQPPTQPPTQPPAQPADPGRPPAVDLVDEAPRQGERPAVGAAPAPGQPTWIFVNGQWVQSKATSNSIGVNRAGDQVTADQLLSQRIIRVPMRPLLSGLPQYNIVIRPGDIIRVPAPVAGLVYVVGQVQRPGPYNLPDIGHLTILRAVDAAGGLSPIAVPERVDITRVVGKARQATLRLDLRAIAEGTMPDIYLRPDDRINVGTNFWAYPLAVIRNGFRASYGFGFVFDRNFADDVLGVNLAR